MALHDDYDFPGPIPPDLDAPEEAGDPEQMIDDAFRFADDCEVDVERAILTLADAEPDRWRVGDDNDAEWALRHLAEAQAELDALRVRALRWQEKIEAWFVQAARGPARRAEFWTAHVEWYGRRARAAGRKSVPLPSGRIATRSTPPCAEVSDVEAVAKWAAADKSRLLVAPPLPPKVNVAELRKRTSVVTVIDAARLTLANSGEIVEWGPDVAELVQWGGDEVIARLRVSECPQVGDGWPNPEEATDIVAQVEVTASHEEVVDEHGQPVPGAVARPEHVSVTVTVNP